MFDIAIECMFIPILKQYSVFCIFITIFCILHFYNNILYLAFLFSFYSGEKVASFPNGRWTFSRFVFSPDNTMVAVYAISRSGDGPKGVITIHNIASPEAISVNVEGFSAPEIPLASYHPVALSANNRYLVVGHEALRVWDVQNLPENVADRLPIYRYGGPKALIQSVRFADWGVIETTSAEGVQHWDLHTGEFIPG